MLKDTRSTLFLGGPLHTHITPNAQKKLKNLQYPGSYEYILDPIKGPLLGTMVKTWIV